MGCNRVVTIVVTLFLIGIGVLGTQNIMAFEFSSDEKIPYLDFQTYTGNRFHLFNDTRIDYCVVDNDENPKFNDIAVNAIKTWHDRIVEVTQNPYSWDMTMHIFPEDPSICDGFVNFYDTPNPELFQISGVMGFSHPATQLANVTIYTDDYQSTLLEMAENDENFWEGMTLEKFQYLIKNGDHKQFDESIINRVTLHEIGHSLSLNHPFTYDGDLSSASGIMGYNMSYNEINDKEVLQIVRAYPNGFTNISSPESISLDNPENKKTFNLGEIVNLTIELPDNKNQVSPSGIELYIFPEGTISQKAERAPIKVIRTEGHREVTDNSEYIDDLHAVMTHWDTSAKVLSVQFKVVEEFSNADMIVVGHDSAGFESQWFLDDVMSVERALFSNILLESKVSEYKHQLMGLNPNRDIENDSYSKAKQLRLYYDALSDCLEEFNSVECKEKIKIEDFRQDLSSIPIWMP